MLNTIIDCLCITNYIIINNIPTLNPTNDPISDPTPYPTNDPMPDPTNGPVSGPNNDPTSELTNDPYSDLWILASYVAIEEMGGPVIEFKPGRSDADSGNACPAVGRLPDAALGAQHVRDVFYR